MVLLDDTTGVLHRLEPVAAIVWSCFDGSGTIEEIAADLSAEFGTRPARVVDDVVGLARELGRLGLLEGVAAEWETAEPLAAPVETAVEIGAAEPRYLVEPPST